MGIFKTFFLPVLISLFLLIPVCLSAQEGEFGRYQLIAHRGGVVDSIRMENSMAALEEAIHRGYYMVEIDLRSTSDGVWIAHHDKNFKRYYQSNQMVGESTWKEIKQMGSQDGRPRPLLIEELLRACKGRAQVMIDNKVNILDTALFNGLLALLKKYDLLDNALMIGADASTDFFTGKIKLSCTRQQLEANMAKPDYRSSNYYLFSGGDNLKKEDVAWAKTNNLMVVAAVNRSSYRNANDPMAAARSDIERFISYGVEYFQIDSEYDPFFY